MTENRRLEDPVQTQQDPMQAAPSRPVTMTRAPLVIPTYLPKPPVPYPIFHQKRAYQGASGRVYPLSVTDALGHEKRDKAWDCCTLENEYLKVQVLPEIGGRIHMGLDKTNGYPFIYHNQVIKPALIGLAGPWCAGGIEFNWPQHHRPTTFLPLETSLQENPDGSRTVWTGETEPMYGMKAMTGVTLHPGRSYLKVKVRAYNPTPWPQPFMWWANLGVHANDGYRIHFPPDVHQVAFHDRASVTTWPILTGMYADQDFGDGVDASWYKNLRNAGSFMVMDGDSRYDFVQGYDTGKRAGTIHVADHHVSPGKKLFTWGTNESAQAWCRNLTDEDGPYIELMTGMFTDNQPDFSWLAPEETRLFEHCWYPVRDIGLVKNATEDAAVSLEWTDAGIRIGLHATGRFPACRVVLSAAGNGDAPLRALYDATLDLAPDAPFLHTVAWPENTSDPAREKVPGLVPVSESGIASSPPAGALLRITLTDASGRLLVAFDERDEAVSRARTYPSQPARTPTPDPDALATNEELYLYGLHLEQYRHHSLDPEALYREALARDPDDYRCNRAMGLRCLKRGQFREAEAYLRTALARQTLRNTNPEDGETGYLLGLALRHQGRDEEAYDPFAKADWNHAWQSASRLQMAELACRAGRFGHALFLVERALSVASDSLRGLNLKAAILRHLCRWEEAVTTAETALALDPLNHMARWELGLVHAHTMASPSGEPYADDGSPTAGIARLLSGKPQAMVDMALAYQAAGFIQDAFQVLENLQGDPNPIALSHQASLLVAAGRRKEAIQLAHLVDRTDPALCHPNRLEDIHALEQVRALHPEGSRAAYALGNLLYDRDRFEEAIACWEAAVRTDTGFAAAHRNLAMARFDKRQDIEGAKTAMQMAFHAAPTDACLLYEWLQLQKNAGDVSVAERLRLVETHADLAVQRNDLYGEWMILLLQAGRLDEAAERITARHYDVYEGGEGRMVRVYEWIHILRGLSWLDAGEPALALAEILCARTVPDCFHEGRNQHASLSHIHWFAGFAAHACGKAEEADSLFRLASEGPAMISDLSCYKGLALAQTGREAEARALFQAMESAGAALVAKGGRYDHFATGVPTPAPFEGDRARRNQSEGFLLEALAQAGLGDLPSAWAKLDAVLALQANHLSAWIHAGKCGVSVIDR